MFKKINQKLLSKYPLLWNTKVVFVLPIAAIIHVLFYLAGFIVPIQVDELWMHHYFEESSVASISVLISVLLIIIWLVFYLRNNPFKSFYTLGRRYMFKEFALIFLIFFSSATFFLSYKQGLYDNVNLKTKDIDIIKDATLINLSGHFIAFDYSDFNANGCCDSIEARRVRDSLETEYKNTLSTSELNKYLQRKRDLQKEAKETASDEKHSYLHYCKREVTFYNTPIEELLPEASELNIIAHRWLFGGKRDSLQHLFTNLLVLCNKYGADYNFDPKQQVRECFNDSEFTVRQTIYRYYVDSTDYYRENDYGEYNDDYDEQVRNYLKTFNYIDISDLSSALHRINTVRNGFWNIHTIIIWLYYSLGLTIVLFSFRVTRLKHWFMGGIGIGLWAILLTLIEVSFRLDKQFPALLLCIWGIVSILSILYIVNRKRKLLSGIMYNWMLWFMPFVLPLIFVAIEINTGYNCHLELYKETTSCQIHHWINSNWVTINIINMWLMIGLVFFVFIPLVRKWQSNPDE